MKKSTLNVIEAVLNIIVAILLIKITVNNIKDKQLIFKR